jgi:hypothetical protein
MKSPDLEAVWLVCDKIKPANVEWQKLETYDTFCFQLCPECNEVITTNPTLFKLYIHDNDPKWSIDSTIRHFKRVHKRLSQPHVQGSGTV